MNQEKTGDLLPFQASTYVEAIRKWTELHGDRPAFTYLGDGGVEQVNLTYRELDRMARAVGALLQQHGAHKKPVLLAFPPGRDFLVAFLGCLYGGAIAVPAYPPDPQRLGRTLPRFQAIALDCQAEFALTTAISVKHLGAVHQVAPKLKDLKWMSSDDLPAALAEQWTPPDIGEDDFAFLQYTSGSTGTPKGVMVSHRNLVLNFIGLTTTFGDRPGDTLVTWLPNYHDMGLIDGLLRPFYLGSHGVVMSPMTFLKDPSIWAKMVSKYRAATSGGPNFAYDLLAKKITDEELAGLDLRCWRTAYNGAEPVRADTLRRFAERFAPCGFTPEALGPGYGLAEATLMISCRGIGLRPIEHTVSRSELAQHRVVPVAPDDPDAVTHVGCGKPMIGKVIIVDPETFKVCPVERVGEIWAAGPANAMGYWNKPEATAETFQAKLADTGEGPFLRTGDLGFQLADGELFITGRIKDLVIIRGRNHYPQDIEKTVEQSHPAAFRPGCNAAFSVEVDGEERLVIVQELQRRFAGEDPQWADRRKPDPQIEAFAPKISAAPDKEEVVRRIQQAVAEHHGLQVHSVVLIKPGSIHKTSSGKIQRRACKASFLDSSLDVLFQWNEGQALAKPAPAAPPPAPEAAPVAAAAATDPRLEAVRMWLRRAVAKRVSRPAEDFDDNMPFAAYGLDSKDAVGVVGELEAWLHKSLAATLLFDYPTVERLARFLVLGDVVAAAAPGEAPSADEPIAIVGLGCRFPGADNPREFWKMLCAGRDVIREVPPDRWNVDEFYDPDPAAPGKTNVRRAGFLDDIESFDPEHFGITSREAARMDPQQRLLLEVVWEALEDAGLPRRRLGSSLTGVFVGIANSDFGRRVFLDRRAIDPYFGTGSAYSIVANRVSYLLDLRGPSVAVDTACSSSLVAVHLAMQALRRGECTTAIAAGVNLILSPDPMINFTKAGVMSPDGVCKPFDAAANGYARGEGAGAVVLKPLSRAIADGDPIYATLLGSAVNSDGRSNGLMAPNGKAQEAVLREAWRRAGRAPQSAQYVEAHGTGTKLGDPIEVNALAAVLGEGRPLEQRLRIGSVKSNFGHLEAAAGVAGLIKTALALRHRTLPPSLHYRSPNPEIPFDRIPVEVQTALQPWEASPGEALAGVSSFGFGGTNAHVVLGEAPALPADDAAAAGLPVIAPFSAPTDAGLRDLVKAQLDRWTGEADGSLAQFAYTAAARRDHGDRRVAMVADNAEQLRAQMAAFVGGEAAPGLTSGEALPAKDRRAVFVYQGQGAQWWAMTRELMAKQPSFKATLERCDAVFRPLTGWSLMDELLKPEAESKISQTYLLQPILFAVQVGLTELWRRWGVVPAAVIGHSMGEVASAYVAGAIGFEDAVRLIYHRGRLMQTRVGSGAMAAVELPLAAMEQELKPYAGQLSVAVNNSPNACVIGGEPGALDALLASLTKREIFNRRLRVDVASHGPYMVPIVDEFVRAVGDVACRQPSMPIISTVTGDFAPDQTFDAAYFGRNLAQPVLFHRGVTRLMAAGYSVYVELNVHPVLVGPIRQTYAREGRKVWALPTLHRSEGEARTFLSAAAQLHNLGFPVDFSGMFATPPRGINLAPTPTNRRPCPPEIGNAAASAVVDDALHPFLGRVVETPALPDAQIWEGEIDLSRQPFLVDHQVLGIPVFPATGYLETVRAAAMLSFGGRNCDLEAVELDRAMTLSTAAPRRVQVAFTERDAAAGRAAFKVFSRAATDDDQPWTLHVSGRVRVAPLDRTAPKASPEAVRKAGLRVPAAAHYSSYLERGIQYGPIFQGVQQVRRRDGQALGKVVLPAAPNPRFHVHPALLDACLQVMGMALPQSGADARETFLPVGVERLAVTGTPPAETWSYAAVRKPAKDARDEYTADIALLDRKGQPWGWVEGLKVRRLDPTRLAEAKLDEWFYEFAWQAAKRPKPRQGSTAGRWVVIADDAAFLRRFRKAAAAARREVIEVAPGRSFRDCGRGKYEVNLGDRAAVQALLSAVLPAGPAPNARVVFAATREPANWSPAQLQRRTVGETAAALLLAQELAKRGQAAPALWLLAPTAEDSAKASGWLHEPLRGLGRVLALEFPDIWGGLIDLTPTSQADLAAAVTEIAHPTDEDQIRFHHGERLVGRLVQRAAPAASGKIHCRADGAYLITGGLGSLGLEAAKWLVSLGARHVVLTGRSKFPPHAKWAGAAKRGDERAAALLELEKSGARVVVAQLDVTDEAATRRLLKGLPPLRGVLHAAGVVTPKTADALTPADLDEVMIAKVKGGWALHRATLGAPLDFFVLYSSGSAVWGSKFLAHYGAANAFLDGLARHRRARGLPALSVNWGMWGGGGMSADEATQQLLSRMGMKVMPPEHALTALQRLLAEGAGQGVVSAMNWPVFKPIYEQRQRRRLLAQIAAAPAAAVGAAAPTSLRAEVLAAADPVKRAAMIEDYLAAEAARVLGMPRDKLNRRMSLTDQGMDSLTAGELRNRLEATFGAKVNVLMLLREERLEKTAAAIDEQLPRAGAPAAVEAATRLDADHETLDADIDPRGALPAAWKMDDVLLTGATGFLGAFVLAELCRRPGRRVHCLVRADNEKDGARRLRATLAGHGIWDNAFAERIVPVVGDLAAPRLGLDAKRWDKLAQTIDTIFHVGYLVNFLFTYRDLRPTNVEGTKELMRLAATHAVKPLHFVSSFSVYLTPENTGRVIDEDGALFPGEGAYRETKRACERLIAEAQRRGMPISIYRPPFISWHTTNGAYNDKDYLIKLITGCLALGAAPEVDLRFHLSPVDFVARSLVRLAADPAAINGKYNLIGDEYGTPWPALIATLNQAGAGLNLLPYGEWRERLSQAGPENPLHIFFPVFSSDLPEKGVAVMELFGASSLPERVDAARTRSRLADAPPCPPIDAALARPFLGRLATGSSSADGGPRGKR